MPGNETASVPGTEIRGTGIRVGSGVVRYEPGDQTITVEAGIGLADLGRLLAEHGQFLPNQCWRGRGTVGGLVAAAADGCLDLGYGRVRDRILGVKIALADGTIAKGRGSVVKNVAGYDLPRLMTGSSGSLGVILEVSFKLQPRPRDERSVLFHFAGESDAFAAARAVRESACEPVFLDVLVVRRKAAAAHGTSQGGADLAIGFDGIPARVTGQIEIVARVIGNDGGGAPRILEGDGNAALRTRLDDALSLDGCASPAAAVVRIAALPTLIAPLASGARDAAVARGCAASIDARPALGLAFVTIFAPSCDDLAAAVSSAIERIAEGAQQDALEARKERRPIPAGVHAAVRSVMAASPAGDRLVRVFAGASPNAIVRELSLRLKAAFDPENVFPGVL